jgi:HK97 family phage portal protein
MTWKQQMTGDAINAGNGYSRIVWRGSAVERLIPLNPFAVTTEFLDNGEPLYLLNKGTEKEKRIPFDDMFHLPGFGGNFSGISTIVLAKETLGLALAQEQHATRYFSNGAVLGGTIEFPERPDGKGIGENTINRLIKSFRRKAQGGPNSWLWHILEHGAKANPIGNTNVESQLIEGRRFVIEEIARWLGIRQHTLGALERAIKSNIEEAARELLIFDIMPWYVKWEQVIKRDLILAPQKYHAEFNMEMLLRGETLKRWQSHKIAVELGARNADEVRALEGDNPRPDGRGDRYWEPQANYSTGATAEGDDDPEESESAPALELPPEPPGSLRARAIVKKAVDGLVRKEIAAIERWGPRHAGKPGVWEGWLDDWYEKHQILLVDRLALAPEAASEYCQANKTEILASGYRVVEAWMPQKKRQLIAAAIEEN